MNNEYGGVSLGSLRVIMHSIFDIFDVLFAFFTLSLSPYNVDMVYRHLSVGKRFVTKMHSRFQHSKFAEHVFFFSRQFHMGFPPSTQVSGSWEHFFLFFVLRMNRFHFIFLLRRWSNSIARSLCNEQKLEEKRTSARQSIS